MSPFSSDGKSRKLVCASIQAIVEQDPVFTNADNMFLSRPERYRHGLKKSARFTFLRKELNLRYGRHGAAHVLQHI